MSGLTIQSSRDMVVAMSVGQHMAALANQIDHGDSPAQYLLRHGVQFNQRIPSRWQGMPKDCYRNAFRMASRSRGKLRYVEGMANGQFMPFEHAWCIDADNRVVDPTWDYDNSEIEVDFFGIIIALDQVRAIRRIRRDYSSVFWGRYRVDHWLRVRELLEGR